MFRYLFRQKNTRGPVLGIIVATVFIAIAASLLVSLNQQGGDVAAEGNAEAPNIVDQVDDRDRYSVSVEGREVQINAVSPNERMIIYVAPPPTPIPTAPVEVVVVEDTAAKQPDVQITSTPVPDPQVVVAPTETSFGEDPNAAADGVPPTSVPPLANVVPVNQNGLIAYLNHTVSAGETIYRLTQLYNTSVTMLSESGISEADMIPGNVLNIPYANGAACPSGRAYPIREGDTLFRIGVNKGTTAPILQQINGLDANYSIDAGSALCLP